MSKINTFLAVIGMVFLTLSAKAQLSFTFVPSNPDPALGETITVDVVVNGFTDIVSYQYSINWNETLIDYQGVSNFNLAGLSAGNFGTTQVNNGILTTSWSDPMAGSQSVPDGTVLYTITYEVVASSGATTDIEFSQTPLGFEIIQDQGGTLTDITGSTVFNNTTLNIAGGGGGGGGGLDCNFSGFGMTVTSDSAATGDPVCLDVAVCNFTDIVSLQYTMQFNPTILQFDEVNNFNLDNLNGGNFGTTNAGSGFITMSWFDTLGAGLTVPDETVIYSICFTAIGAGGSLDTVAINGALAEIEVTDANSGGADIGLESIDGEVNITGTSGSAVTVLASCETGSPGDTVSVDVSVRNFDSIVGIQFSMLWDPVIVDFLDTEWTSVLPGSPGFNTSPVLTDAGKLTFGWNDPLAAGVNLPNDEIIFRVRYIVTGNITDVSVIDFTDDPTPTEVSQVVDGNLEVVPLAKIPGKVEVIGEGVLTLNLGTPTGCTGDTVYVPITVENFNEIVSMQYDVIWSNGVELNYLNVQDFNLNGLNSGSFNLVNPSRLRIAWVEPLLDPQTKLDGDTLYVMCFEILSADMTNPAVEFDDSATIEFTEGSNADPVASFIVNDGGVTVDCTPSGQFEVSDTLITDVLCFGDATGAIDITVENAQGPVTYSWSPGGANTQDITDLIAGDYTVTIDDGTTTLIETYTVGEPAEALSVTMSAQDATTNGGSDGEATATPAGGTAPYTYQWDDAGNGTTQTITGLPAGIYNVTVTDDNGCTITDQVEVSEPGSITLTLTIDHVLCNGDNTGEISVTPSGGAAPYSYNWDPNVGSGSTISDLTAGTYDLTVTDDNSVTATASITINEPSALTLDVSDDNVSCNGESDGTATATPGGGVGPYTYQWDDAGNSSTQMISGLPAGQFSVTVTDDNGCTIEGTTFVSEPDELTISGDITHESTNGANDGEIDVTINGGTAGYTFEWSDSGITDEDRTGLSPGDYTVTVTDANDCTAVETFTVYESILIVVVSQVNPNCNGASTGSININVTGGVTPYTYEWDDAGNSTTQDISNLPAGSYNVTVTGNNGFSVVHGPITLTEPDPIQITVDASSNINCNGEATGSIDITVTGGTPNPDYDYDWGFGITDEDPSGLQAGDYTVTVTDDNGCTRVGPTVTLTEPDPITVNSSSTGISCNAAADGTITVNVSGGLPNYDYNWNNGLPNQPNHTGVDAGTYIVTITDALGCSMVEGPIAVTQPAELTLSNTVVNASGSNDDGSIDLTVAGGTPNYTYNWNNGASSQDLSGLASGCYAVTVEDANGCIITDSIKVGGTIVITSTIEDVSCAGSCDGEIDITITGGISPYTFSWAGGNAINGIEDQTNLCAGNYAVTVFDSNGSQSTETFIVGTPTALTITASNVQNETGDGCNGSIDLSVTGGTLPYTYQWSNGANSEDVDDLCKGDYSVTIVDANGCVLISNTFTVLPPPLVVAVSSMTMASCFGEDDGEVCLSVLGGCGPYSITLNSETITSVSGEDVCFGDLAAGSYSIIIMDSGNPQMVIIHPFTITEPDPIVITLVSVTNNTDPTLMNCNGAINISVTGGSGNYDYEWSNNFQGQDPTGLCHIGSPYSVTVTDANNNECLAVYEDITVELGLNIQIVEANNVTCFDECDGTINIDVTGGVTPYSYIWSTGSTNQDINSLCAGTYNVTVTDGQLNTATLIGVTIDQPASPLAVTVVDATRPTNDDANGSIEIDVTGGWGGYQVVWSNGAAGELIGGLTEGFYTATITDAQGCVLIQTIELVAYRLTLEFVPMLPTCNGDADGEIELLVSDGSGDYTIEWSNEQSGELAFSLIAGTYCVTVTDDNIPSLSETQCFDLEEPDVLAINAEVTNSSGPANGSICLDVQGGTEPYTYLWNTSGGDITPCVTGLSGGEYSVRVEDENGCTEFATFSVEVVGECLEGRKVISPNNDGKNDELIISCVERFNNNLKIFNRWGQLVYEVDNYDNSWSGTDFEGDLLPESGYFWVLEYDEGGETKQLKGAFTLLRGE